MGTVGGASSEAITVGVWAYWLLVVRYPSYRTEVSFHGVVVASSRREPVRHSSTWEGDSGETVSWAETVDRLMDQATDIVDIDLVMADREFDQHEVYHVLDQYHDVDYLILKKQILIRLSNESTFAA